MGLQLPESKFTTFYNIKVKLRVYLGNMGRKIMGKMGKV